MTTPQQLQAGDDLSWDYPGTGYSYADGWRLHIIARGPQEISIAAGGAGDTHQVAVSQETSAAWQAGSYVYQVYVLKDGVRVTLERGRITVLADLVAGDAPRSHARRMLDAIEAVLEKRASKVQSEYTVNGVAFKYMTLDELQRARRHYAQMVHKEEVAAGLKPKRSGAFKIGFR